MIKDGKYYLVKWTGKGVSGGELVEVDKSEHDKIVSDCQISERKLIDIRRKSEEIDKQFQKLTL